MFAQMTPIANRTFGSDKRISDMMYVFIQACPKMIRPPRKMSQRADIQLKIQGVTRSGPLRVTSKKKIQSRGSK